MNEEQLLHALRALRSGDLSVRLPAGGDGTAGEIASTFNELVDLLGVLTPDVTRIAREVGTEGKFGGQVEVAGLGDSGIWRDLTDSLNIMSGNLTAQWRSVAHVVTAIANGDLACKIGGDPQGEVLELVRTLDVMGDQLSALAAEVTRLARETGEQGRFGAQAEVKGLSGTWEDVVANLNLMAADLTNQLRDMKNVTRAALEGDLSRRVTVDAQEEMLELKNSINALLEKLSTRAVGE